MQFEAASLPSFFVFKVRLFASSVLKYAMKLWRAALSNPSPREPTEARVSESGVCGRKVSERY
jgi:hypothetical protein